MATNEILQFASTDTGTNLLTQVEYTADAQRTTGNQPGIARSKLVNKALRQASLIAAGLAEFIADYQANNVTDSLTPQNIADYLLAAITANIPVVPDASTTVKGKVQLATATEAQAFADALKALTPSTLNQAFKGSNQSIVVDNGYQKLPGGIIIQWTRGAWTNVGDSVQTLTWPIAFPNTCLNATVSTIHSNSVYSDLWAAVLEGASRTNCPVVMQWNGGGSTSSGATPLAIGIGY